jgi:hypothetical protein
MIMMIKQMYYTTILFTSTVTPTTTGDLTEKIGERLVSIGERLGLTMAAVLYTMN